MLLLFSSKDLEYVGGVSVGLRSVAVGLGEEVWSRRSCYLKCVRISDFLNATGGDEGGMLGWVVCWGGEALRGCRSAGGSSGKPGVDSCLKATPGAVVGYWVAGW